MMEKPFPTFLLTSYECKTLRMNTSKVIYYLCLVEFNYHQSSTNMKNQRNVVTETRYSEMLACISYILIFVGACSVYT